MLAVRVKEALTNRLSGDLEWLPDSEQLDNLCEQLKDVSKSINSWWMRLRFLMETNQINSPPFHLLSNKPKCEGSSIPSNQIFRWIKVFALIAESYWILLWAISIFLQLRLLKNCIFSMWTCWTQSISLSKHYYRMKRGTMEPHGSTLKVNRGFPKLNLNWIELIELIWITLAIVNINSCVTSKIPIIKKKLPFGNKINCKHIFTVHSK